MDKENFKKSYSICLHFAFQRWQIATFAFLCKYVKASRMEILTRFLKMVVGVCNESWLVCISVCMCEYAINEKLNLSKKKSRREAIMNWVDSVKMIDLKK